MSALSTALPAGVLLPERVLFTDSFKVIATFVALNTLMYAALAVIKLLPRDGLRRRSNGRNRRSQNRSIYPEPPDRRTGGPSGAANISGGTVAQGVVDGPCRAGSAVPPPD